ncbi:MAG: hypothetical protein SGBAC_003391 [Bacillariaceae sp.]
MGMKVNIRIVGRKSGGETWLEDACEMYLTRLRPSGVEVDTTWHKDNPALIKGVETDASKGNMVVLLDPLGKTKTSEQFSEDLYEWLDRGGSRMSFVIGGAEGLPSELKYPPTRQKPSMISLSSMTFTHQFARLLLIEQIYRGTEIHKGSGYHNYSSAPRPQTEPIVNELVQPYSSRLASTGTGANTGIRALRQVSTSPLVFTIDNYVEEELLAVLSRNGGASAGESDDEQELLADARLQFATMIAGELFAGQWGPNDGLRFNMASSSDDNNDRSTISIASCPEGLHVDTNNDSTFRSVTIILYLNDISDECGGATVFPLANAKDKDPVMVAATRLLNDDIAHTRGPRATLSDGISLSTDRRADASLLEASVGTIDAPGLRVQPQAGRLCIFFSRLENGDIDPRSWHGGERLLCQQQLQKSSSSKEMAGSDGVTEKRILTLFKEVYYAGNDARPDSYETTFENYLAPQIKDQRRFLQALAESHEQYFQEDE